MTLEDVYTQHSDFAWRCLRRQGVPRDDVADAMQEVFLVVHRTLDAFEGRSSLRTWLFTICRSVARDRRERAYQRLEVARSEAIGDGVDERADAAARLEHNDRLSLLETILGRMEPDLRDVFVLFEIEDMTGDEIGQALSIPPGTAYSRLQLARKAFKRAVARLETGQDRPLAHAGATGVAGVTGVRR
jgi:RNA polymerase sigma-70 factor (ECF subfamily)